MATILCLSTRWENNLSVNDRYSRGDRPRLRPEVATWQEELAWKVKEATALQGIEWPEDACLLVDIQMRFPDDGKTRDPDNFIKSAFDGLQAGLGVDDSQFIPVISSVRVVDSDEGEEPSFTFKICPAQFNGHGVTGMIAQEPGFDGSMIIVLDDDLPEQLVGARVRMNMGVINVSSD